jgi:hypothetical protein
MVKERTQKSSTSILFHESAMRVPKLKASDIGVHALAPPMVLIEDLFNLVVNKF